jgi:hypothetical protein
MGGPFLIAATCTVTLDYTQPLGTGGIAWQKREATVMLLCFYILLVFLGKQSVKLTLVIYEGVARPSIEPGASAYDLQRYSDLWNWLPTSEGV